MLIHTESQLEELLATPSAADVDCLRRLSAVSRFSSPSSRTTLESVGVETIACDLLDRAQINQLPDCENIKDKNLEREGKHLVC